MRASKSAASKRVAGEMIAVVALGVVTAACDAEPSAHANNPGGTGSSHSGGTGSGGGTGTGGDGPVTDLAVTRVAYYRDATASEVLVLGTAPRNLIAQLRLSFRTSDDRELDVDQDADGITDGVFIDVPQSATNERFFRQFANSPGFRDQVPRVAVAAIGSDGDITDAVAANLSDAPARKLGEVCDPYGFDRCPSAAVCSPGVPNTVNRCRAVDEQRSSLCEAAPRIRLDGPSVEVQSITGASTWRWYEGCVASELGQRSDTALRLELEAPVSELVLESLNGTASDTDAVLSLYRDCGLEETDALGCNDDRSEESPEALLVLKNVPKGRYLVVVDAFRGTGPVQVRAYSR